MTEDEAIGILKTMCTDNFCIEQLKTKQAIETILGELEKKDKIIELMIKHLCDVIDSDDNASLLPFYDSDDNLEEKVKEYFERKVENE